MRTSPLKLFDIAKNEKRLLYVSAPMVRYSKARNLAFIQEYILTPSSSPSARQSMPTAPISATRP
jgi:hypothetical protein